MAPCTPGPHAAARRPSLLLVGTLVISMVAALALVGVAATLADSIPSAPAGGPGAASHVALVRAFYAAVNDAVRTGDATSLDGLVTPDFAWCDPCFGHAPTRDGLRRHLTALHQTAPAARLTIDAAVADELETVTAQVHSAAYPLAVAPLWGPIDTFRLDGGLLAARRSGSAGVALAAPLIGADVAALPPAVTGMALARLTFSPGSGARGLLSPGPTLLVVEAGTLTTRIARGGRIARAGAAPPALDGQGPPLETVLGRGDAAIVPAGIRYDLIAAGATPAVALGATLYLAEEGVATTPRRPDQPLFVPWAGPVRVAPSTQAQPTVQMFAAGAAPAWPPGPVRLGLARLILGSGGVLAPPPDEMDLVAVDAGTLAVDGMPPRLIGAGEGMVRRAGAGEGMVRRAGAAGSLRAVGDGPLVLLVLTVAPAA